MDYVIWNMFFQKMYFGLHNPEVNPRSGKDLWIM